MLPNDKRYHKTVDNIAPFVNFNFFSLLRYNLHRPRCLLLLSFYKFCFIQNLLPINNFHVRPNKFTIQ